MTHRFIIVGKNSTISAQLDAMRGRTVPAIRCGATMPAEDELCPGCGDGENVPVNGYWKCPVCDVEWFDEDEPFSDDLPASKSGAFDGRHVGEQDADGFRAVPKPQFYDGAT